MEEVKNYYHHKATFFFTNAIFDEILCKAVFVLITELNLKVHQLDEALQLSQELYHKEKEKRKELHNTLVQVRGNIRVHCRVRPVLSFDSNFEPDEAALCKNDDDTIIPNL